MEKRDLKERTRCFALKVIKAVERYRKEKQHIFWETDY